MKEIKDYMHLYLGCEVFTGTGKVTLTGIHIDKWSGIEKAVVLNGNYTHTTDFEGLKPILRPLSDMTEEEKEYCYHRYCEYCKYDYTQNYGEIRKSVAHWIEKEGGIINSYKNPETLRYLLSHHFDLFNLIGEGLAIDKTTLK